MERVRSLFFLAIFFVALFAALPAHSQQSSACDGCSLVQDALKASDALKPGMTRKEVEAEFVFDGGIQTGWYGRYVFRRCRTIKIDVRFTGAQEGRGAEGLPTDKVLGVSRPYLELSISD